MFSKPAIYFRRELPSGFGKLFGRAGSSLPQIAVTGTLVLASTDTPPEEGSILTLTDELVFDPAAEVYDVELQVNDGSGWEPVDHDITDSAYEVPAVVVETSWRVVATADVDGYATRIRVSNILTTEEEDVGLFSLLGFDDDEPLLGFNDDEPLEYET